MDKNSQSIAFGGCPAFLPEEIDYWLNLAMYQEINTKFTGNNTSKIAFEGSTKRTHDLEGLLRTDIVDATKDITTNRCYVTNLYNGRRLYFIGASFVFDSKQANTQLVSHDVANKFKQTHNNIPWIENPICVIEDNTLYVYYDPISMNADNYSVHITYLKEPTKVEDLPTEEGMTEFPEYMQHEIVNRAVELALEDIESRRVETKTQLNQLDE